MMFAADIEAISPDWLKNLAIFVACFSATAFYLKGIFNSKQKREVSFSEIPASKERLDKLEAHTTRRHAEIFSSIERNQKEIRREVDDRFTALGEERKESLEKLNDQFVFIRESIAEIKTELKLRHKS